MFRLALPLFLVLTLLLAALPFATAEEPTPERPKLVEHPFKDAKPGEYLRFVIDDGSGWKQWYVERVLDVREGEVLWVVSQVSEDGSKDLSRVRAGWKKIPEMKPAEHQRILKDEMVEMEIDAQKIWCRHLYIEELEEPPFPEPKRRKDVWYSNDVPCSGKVKDTLRNRMVTSWGMMSADELKQRQEAWRKAEQGQNPNDG